MQTPVPDTRMHSNSRMVTTRESWRALACYVLGPARYAWDGHIWLAVDGRWVRHTRARRRDACWSSERTDWSSSRTARRPITTVRAAAAFVGIELSAAPPVGHDLPPFEPDRHLEIDVDAAAVLADWWALGEEVLATLGEPQLWPEHFDMAIIVELPGGVGVNVGFSPGDAGHDAPYVYVGPHDVPPTSIEMIPTGTPRSGPLLPRHEVTRRTGRARVHPERVRTSHLTYSDIGI